MAATQQRGARCNRKLCLKVWICNQKAIKCARTGKDGPRSVFGIVTLSTIWKNKLETTMRR